ncbi:MAG: FMN-dependent NADH-azoreductase [Marinifilaceae bacterium]
MAKKLLYITANPKQEGESFSLQAGKVFLEAYKEKNPQNEVNELDLFQTRIPQLNALLFGAFGKLQEGIDFSDLSSKEQEVLSEMNQLLEQFMQADEYVVVNPLWNFSIPPVLKAYLDVVVQAGKTFRYTENGPIGLLESKKALHIQASGGVYSEGPAKEMEFGHRYLKSILGFIGIQDLEFIPVEGTSMGDDQAKEILYKAQNRAVEIAREF